jgi:hypothetical protein
MVPPKLQRFSAVRQCVIKSALLFSDSDFAVTQCVVKSARLFSDLDFCSASMCRQIIPQHKVLLNYRKNYYPLLEAIKSCHEGRSIHIEITNNG